MYALLFGMDYGRAPHKEFDFLAWRKRMGWTQSAAAEQLSLSRRGYQVYEKAYAGDLPRRVPKPVIKLAQTLEKTRQTEA